MNINKIMTTLLISKEEYTLKEARKIANQFMVSGKCRTVLWDINLFYCFGPIPTEDVVYDVAYTKDKKLFYISVLPSVE